MYVSVNNNFISRYLSVWRHLQICLFSYSQRKILGISGKNQGFIMIEYRLYIEEKIKPTSYRWTWTYSICGNCDRIATLLSRLFLLVTEILFLIARTIFTCIILSKSLTYGHTLNIKSFS